MLWKLILSILYWFPSASVDKPSQNQVRDEPWPPPYIPPRLISPYGPQTAEEWEQAHKALYSESDMIFPRGFGIGASSRNIRYRWTGYPGGAVVPYVIDSSLASQKELIEQAMNQYNQLTCAKFVPRTSESDYIHIKKGSRCKSVVGRQSGRQELTLSEGCFYIGTIVHELGHALGLLHEHQRPDRDSYITIYDKNVTRGQWSNFNKISATPEAALTNFNYNSIMMYGNYAFSKQQGKLMTMEAKNGEPLHDPYTKPGLDDMDIEKVNKFYRCE